MTDDNANPRPARPGVRLSPDEAWERIAASHTGIFTTLRRDGVPISLPVWFVALDRQIYVTTPPKSKKVARVRNDARSSFLVEAGERWAELTAVHLTGSTTIIDADDDLIERIGAASDAKYSAFRTVRSEMPTATREHYGRTSAYLRFTPDERIVSWDNARLFS